MSLNQELAAFGEPPATVEEQALAELLEAIMARHDGQNTTTLDQVQEDTPRLSPSARRLADNVRSFWQGAIRLWDHSGLCDSARSG